VAGRTVAMRSKEEAHDYRYFPEPDLPVLEVTAERVEEIRRALPELPEARKHRLVAQYDLPEYDADILTQSVALGDYFEATAARVRNARAASNWILGEVLRRLKETGTAVTEMPIDPTRLAELIALVERGTISGSVAKDVFQTMCETGATAEAVVAAGGLAQVSDERALLVAIRDVLASNPGSVGQYRAGRTKTFGYLVGQVMKATRGQGNPQVVNDLLRRELEGK
jgi:aspartyl-tRNA(Asn)/glutamyl-tRNA(Gln) amidotransferase subunit B